MPGREYQTELISTAKWIGGPGYTFNRTEIDLGNAAVRRVIAFIVADPHSYARDFFPEYPALEPSTWLLGGSQVKYRIFCNGRFMGLGPARPVDDMPYLHEYDVTEAFRSGRNALGVISLGEVRGFAMAVRIELEDAGERTIVTDEQWRSLPGIDIFRPVFWESPGIDNFCKGGPGPGELPQHIDGRRFPAGWDRAGFDDSRWKPAEIYGDANEEYPVPDIPNLVFSELRPESVVRLSDGHYFFDFGREIIAGLRLITPADRDGRIEVRLGEECIGDSSVRFTLRTMNCYQEMWNTADVPLTLEHFGLRAFRYGELLGWRGEPSPGDIAATVVHYPFDDRAASFECSEGVLNDVWDFCKYSVKATNLDLYQDCPTRERHAYEGDAYVNMLSHYALDSDTRLARHTAEYLLNHPTWPAEWVMLMIPIFWADYMQTGDPSMLKKHYERLRDDFSFHHLLKNGLVEEFPKRVLVDWPDSQRDGYEFGPVNTVANAYVYEDVSKLSLIAAAIGRTEESEELKSVAAAMAKAYNARLFDEASGLYVDHEGSGHSSLHSSLFSLAFGLATPDRSRSCVELLKRRGMVCSVYCSQFMLDVLYEHGEAEYALNLMTSRTGNSWGHMIYDLGATITTESWDPSQKDNMSFAHPWATAPANIVARRLFGIRCLEPGWGSLEIMPQPASLQWAKIRMPTPRGPVSADLKRDGDSISLSFEAAPGSRVIVGDTEYSGKGHDVLRRLPSRTEAAP